MTVQSSNFHSNPGLPIIVFLKNTVVCRTKIGDEVLITGIYKYLLILLQNGILSGLTYCTTGRINDMLRSIMISFRLHLSREMIYEYFSYYFKTHWGRVTHICVSKLTIISSDNGLSPGRRQAIIWTNAGILLIGPLGTNFSEILIAIHTFLFKKLYLKMSSGKWRPFCLGLSVLKECRLW